MFGNEIIGDGFNMSAKEFQAAIDPYVNSILFISCDTAQGPAGANFLQEIHDSIPTVAGFSFPITVHTTGFDQNAQGGGLSLTSTPEPSSLWVVVLGSAAVCVTSLGHRTAVARTRLRSADSAVRR
jgi:hypothetical protein